MNIGVRFTGLRGESGGGIPKLILNFNAQNTSDHNLGILSATAEVRVAQSWEHFLGSASHFVGYGNPEYLEGHFPKGQEKPWTVGLPLSPYALRKIEDVRKGGDLIAGVLFHCTAAYMQDGASTLTGVARVNIYAPGHSSLQCPVKVAQSDWVKILKDLGYSEHFVIEMPLTGVPSKAGMKKALKHLEDAWEHFSQARDEETLVSCYKAFEFLAKQQNVKDPDQQAFDRLLGRVTDAEKRKRLTLLLKYVCQFLALARHEEGKEKVAFDRTDSEYALILAQASLAYLSRNIGEPASKHS